MEAVQGSQIEAKKLSLETLLKLASAIIGVIFVTGLLINNIFLSNLSLTDYSALQIRNVTIGFSFFIYAGFLLAFLAFCIFAVKFTFYLSVYWVKSIGKKILFTCLALLFWSSIFVSLMSLVGVIIGYLLPWGRSWDAGFAPDAYSVQFIKEDLINSYTNVHFAYSNPKVIVFGTVAVLFGLFLTPSAIDKPLLRLFPEMKDRASNIYVSVMGPYKKYIYAWLGASGYLLLIFAYAIDVFPNVITNMGGGQPKIVRLYVENGDLNLPELFNNDATLEKDSSKSTPKHIESRLSLMWYEDEHSIYLTPIGDSLINPIQIISINSKKVYAKKYYSGYIKAESGTKVTGIYR